MHGKTAGLTIAIAAAALTLVACGDGNPTSPSGMGGVSVQGVLLGESASVTSSSTASAKANGGPVTVVVEGTSISVTISGNGTFELQDVPAGTFTLVFFQDGAELGRVTITAGEGTRVKIVVQKKGAVVVVIDLELEDDGSDDDASRSCMINGGRVGDGIELEGDVTSGARTSFQMATNGNRASGPVDVDASGASFKCNGKTGGDDCQGAVKPGAKVHVRGSLTSCTVSDAAVKATEVKVQKAADQ